MKHIIKSLKALDWIFVVLTIGLVVCQVWLDLTLPDYTANLTEEVSKGTASMAHVWKNGGMMLVCAFGSMLCSFACGFFTSRVASSLSLNLRTKLFRKISTFSSTEMKKFATPSLITRTTNDVSQLQMFVAMGLQMIIKAPALAIWAICKISNTSVEWTATTLAIVLVIIVLVCTLVAVCLPKFKKVQKLIDNLNNATRESVSGVRVVRAFNAENYQEEKFEKANKSLTSNQLFTSRTMGLMSPIMTICMNGLTLAIYWIGALLINNADFAEKATVFGNMTAFTQYAMQVVMAFMLLIMIVILLPRTIVSSKRISEILNTKSCIDYGTIETSDIDSQNKLEFKNVSFSYNDGGEDVISNISFTAKKGETIAFIGATGSGKTTIIDLIPRYYDVDDGEIFIDGINIKDYTEEALQNKVAMVSQKAVLFKGDIKSNITYGCKDDISDDDSRIKESLNIAQANFVFDLEEDIHSPVAQGGTNFSGGQKQRLSIARALFKNSDIIIFDDSFSALDYKTDALVRKNIKDKLDEKTILIVAQRIGTILNADKIIVLDKGKIVGQGKHEQLLETCPVYKEIALSQLSKEEL